MTIPPSSPARERLGLEIVEQVPDFDAVIVPVGGGGLARRRFVGHQNIAAASENHRGRSGKRRELFRRAGGRQADAESRCIRHWPTASPFRRSAQTRFAIAQRACRSNGDCHRGTNRDRDSCASLNWRKASSKARPRRRWPPVFPVNLKNSPANVSFCFSAAATSIRTCLSRVIERGLVADGRLCRFTAMISDRPGGLADLADANRRDRREHQTSRA